MLGCSDADGQDLYRCEYSSGKVTKMFLYLSNFCNYQLLSSFFKAAIAVVKVALKTVSNGLTIASPCTAILSSHCPLDPNWFYLNLLDLFWSLLIALDPTLPYLTPPHPLDPTGPHLVPLTNPDCPLTCNALRTHRNMDGHCHSLSCLSQLKS